MRIITLTLLLAASAATAQVDYSISDGDADLTLSIDSGETIVFLNTFPVDPDGTFVDRISAAYGRVGGPSALDGLPVTILLYEDLDGGSPQNAELLWSTTTPMRDGNTDVLNDYPVPLVRVRHTLVVGFLFRNTRPFPIFIGALDTDAPIELERSWTGFDIAISPSNLTTIPKTQWGPQEDFAASGNFRIEARGQTTDGIDLTLSSAPGITRLEWTGPAEGYTVERSAAPLFDTTETLAVDLQATSFDDSEDGQSWYYLVF